MNIKTNLIGRIGSAEIWEGKQTEIEIVAVWLNCHNEKHPSVSCLVRDRATGKFYPVTANRITLIY